MLHMSSLLDPAVTASQRLNAGLEQAMGGMVMAKDWAMAETGMLVVLSLAIAVRLFALWRTKPEAATQSTSPVHRRADISLSLTRAYADRKLRQQGSRQASPSQEQISLSNTPSSRRKSVPMTRTSRLRALMLKKHDPAHRGRQRVLGEDSGSDDARTDEEESDIYPTDQSTRPSAQQQQQTAACSARLDCPVTDDLYANELSDVISSDKHAQQTAVLAMEDTSYVPSWNTWGARVDAVLCSSGTDDASTVDSPILGASPLIADQRRRELRTPSKYESASMMDDFTV